MVTKRTANAIIIAGTGEQCIDLLDCSLRAAEPQLQHALHLLAADRRLARGSCSIAFRSSFCSRAALLLQPLQQPRNLVDPGDGAAGDLGELLIDLRRCSLCNLACSLGEFPIDTEAAAVDPAAQLPERCSAGDSGGSRS